jgi:hypothetical protein
MRFVLRLFTTSLLAVLHCLMVSGATASDWPQFRGPNRDGNWDETGILESFPAQGLKIRWRHSAGGGFSSPVVADGRVFLSDVALTKPASRRDLSLAGEPGARQTDIEQYLHPCAARGIHL